MKLKKVPVSLLILLRSSYWTAAPKPLIYHPPRLELTKEVMTGINTRSLTFQLTGFFSHKNVTVLFVEANLSSSSPITFFFLRTGSYGSPHMARPGGRARGLVRRSGSPSRGRILHGEAPLLCDLLLRSSAGLAIRAHHHFKGVRGILFKRNSA